MGPVIECGPPPGFARRSATISSIVIPGRTLSFECIIVSIETVMHSHDKVRPGITIDEIVALRRANPGGGPHSVTGPIYVNGADTGDVMEIRTVPILPKPFGINFNLPGKDFPPIGALAPQ